MNCRLRNGELVNLCFVPFSFQCDTVNNINELACVLNIVLLNMLLTTNVFHQMLWYAGYHLLFHTNDVPR